MNFFTSCGFNPTLVRLRPGTDRHARGIPSSFNPTLVRLRPLIHLPDPTAYPMFQSHAGSIEAPAREERTTPDRTFQSHAGSIEASPLPRLAARPAHSFNPTLVRLRPPEARCGPSPTPPFQSHAGSIEAPLQGLEGRQDYRFQSHAGSIEAHPRHARLAPPIECFNPTLVRLRRPSLHQPTFEGPSFNPTLVRLRREGCRGVVVVPESVSIPRWFD